MNIFNVFTSLISTACAVYFVWHSFRSAMFMNLRTCNIIRFVAVGFCIGGFAVVAAWFYPKEDWAEDFGVATIMLSMVGLMRFGRRPGIDNILPAIKLPDDPDATQH